MAFRVHAAGTGGFRYPEPGPDGENRSRQHVEFGDVYELADCIDRVNSRPDGVADMLEDEAVNAASGDSPLQQALNAMGRISSVEKLRAAYQFLLIRFGSFHFTLQVTDEAAWYDPFPDESAVEDMDVYSDDSFTWFLREITDELEVAGLNTWGGLDALADVLIAFEQDGGRDRGQVRLLVQMTRD